MKKLLLLFSYLIFSISSFSQPIIYVTPTGAGDNSGSSWTNALPGTQLPSHVVSASDGTQFWMAAGTYKPTTTTDRTASFSIASGVSVYGGFAGTETGLEQRMISTSATILSGDIGSEHTREDNSQRVISLFNVSGTITLNGLAILDGRIMPSDYGSMGSGLYVELTNSSLTLLISNCLFNFNIIVNNFSGGGGIGVWSKANGKCDITIRNSSFFANQGGYGGAISTQTAGGSVTSLIEDCTFSNNIGLDESGAISNRYVDDAISNSLTIRRCKFLHNTALFRGGAISMGSSQCEIENSLFDHNFVTYSAGSGGAIDGTGSNSVFTNCIFTNNKAAYGGVMYSISQNKITQQTFNNCTFSRDTAFVAGGVFCNLQFPGEGTGISFTSVYPNITSLKNCLIWQNTAPDSPVFKSQLWLSPESDRIYNTFSPTYSLIQSNYPGTGNLNTGPLFVDPTNGDFRLKPNSPAINAGDPTIADLPTTDLAGQARVQGGRVDMGAYEFTSCFGLPCLPFTVERKK